MGVLMWMSECCSRYVPFRTGHLDSQQTNYTLLPIQPSHPTHAINPRTSGLISTPSPLNPGAYPLIHLYPRPYLSMTCRAHRLYAPLWIRSGAWRVCLIGRKVHLSKYKRVIIVLCSASRGAWSPLWRGTADVEMDLCFKGKTKLRAAARALYLRHGHMNMGIKEDLRMQKFEMNILDIIGKKFDDVGLEGRPESR